MNPEPRPTDDLVLRAQGGDPAAYERLFERVAERLLLYIRLRMGPTLTARHEPMDVLQEAWVEAHRGFAGFLLESEGAFAAWMYRIVDHTLHDLARRAQAQKRRAPRGEVAGDSVWARLRADQDGLSTACDLRDARLRLEQAVAELERDEREVLLQRHFQERSLSEIAAALDKSETTTRRLLDRARVKLGAALRALGPS